MEGVLGRRVVPALVGAGHAVTANVRNDAARRRADAAGASTITVDLFDAAATARLGADHEAIVNVATNIPTGAAAARKGGWATNDRLRTEASANLAAAVARPGGRYVGESITFPYVDATDDWIDEQCECTYFWGNRSCVDAEAVARSVTVAGGTGLALRFAMFYAEDSAHISTFRAVARRGWFALPGEPESYTSWVDVDDAAAAVVAALGAPPGVYNVAAPDPVQRVDHATALARSVGRRRLRRLPKVAVKLAGPGIESLARSQRISSQSLTSATGWEPTRRRIVDAWQR